MKKWRQWKSVFYKNEAVGTVIREDLRKNSQLEGRTLTVGPDAGGVSSGLCRATPRGRLWGTGRALLRRGTSVVVELADPLQIYNCSMLWATRLWRL